jgi:dTDP-4-dehydrorhamnose reductase
MVFYSTDHVFDGAAERYTETAVPRPLNSYAASKLAGEAAVRAGGAGGALVIRTAWLYGPDPARRNFALRLVDATRAGRETRVPSDQWGTPTYTEDLAAVTRFLVEGGHTGLWHAAGDELLDRVTLARLVCEVFGLDAAYVVPTPTRALGQAARRPLCVRLDSGRLCAAGAPPFRDPRAGLEALRGWDGAHAAIGPRA